MAFIFKMDVKLIFGSLLFTFCILLPTTFSQGREYLPPPNSKYGPPGYKPGEPIGLAAYSRMSSVGVMNNNCPPNNPAANKELVRQTYPNFHNISTLPMFFHEEYIQHNPNAPDGLDGLRNILSGPFGQGPWTIHRISAEDDLVWVHFSFPLLGSTYAAVDILRIECGKIKEHWDVLQNTTGVKSANPHPFF